VSKFVHHRLGQMGPKFERHAKFLNLVLRNTGNPIFGATFARWVSILGSPRGYGVGAIGDRG